MDREVGAYEAKTRLAELLRDVERGDRITITVRGRPVAELAPARRGGKTVAEAVEAMKAVKKVRGASAEDVLAWIAEGRR
jgi:prevent-host-death family protein